MKPYAVWLLEQFRAGLTVQALAIREGIPAERIQARLAAAGRLEQARQGAADSRRNGQRAA